MASMLDMGRHQTLTCKQEIVSAFNILNAYQYNTFILKIFIDTKLFGVFGGVSIAHPWEFIPHYCLVLQGGWNLIKSSQFAPHSLLDPYAFPQR